jgi:riboflavin synthase
MFTGIIEQLGKIISIEKENGNLHIQVASSLTPELKIDQSVSHNGICLTVVKVENDTYTVTAIQETIQKTNIRFWKVGDEVNLERSMPANGRFDGHIVQGHVDQTAECIEVVYDSGSWIFTFQYDATKGNITVEKGSICVNGISLTVKDSGENHFKVAIIPYTWEHTNLKSCVNGTKVNLEFDILGKYIQRILKK